MIYFTSDHHFGHANVIRHCDRPFTSVEEMDEALISNWNNTVTPTDDIYILGDFTMRPAAEAYNYLSRLNGRKYFIKGNHDRFLKNTKLYDGVFEWVKDYHVLRHDGHKIVLFHYPIAEWDGYFRGAIHLYGHIHNSQKSNDRASNWLAFNVGVDVNELKPVSMDEIIQKAKVIQSYLSPSK